MSLSFAKIEPTMVPSMFHDKSVRVGQCYQLNKPNYPVVMKITSIDETKNKYGLEIYLPIEINKKVKYNKMFAEVKWGDTAASWTLREQCLDNKDVL